MSVEVTAPDVPSGQAGAREVRRLEAIRRWRVLDAEPACFEQIAAVAARIFEVPYSVVSIVDAEHIWFKAHHGLDVESIPRCPGLCSTVVESGDPLSLADARSHPESMVNPLVAGEFGLRFYAGAPLRTSDGHDIGTLGVFDQKGRRITDAEVATLTDLAGVVVREFEVRRAAMIEVTAEKEEAELERARSANLQAALGSHGVIGQAMGILMAQRGYTADDAFDALKAVSQKRNVKLAEVARRLVDDFDERSRLQATRSGT
jgi:GAF domain-containing protein